MQYHQNGYRSGDPRIHPVSESLGQDRALTDVVIVGCGPAGLTLGAQMAAFPDIHTRILERKSGPLELGQADGIACRSMEMFQAFGFADTIKQEAYWVNEVTFWRPDESGTLNRASRIQDVEGDLSEMPHVILNQARVHDLFLDVMGNSPQRLAPDYGRALLSVRRDDHPTHPIVATFECLDDSAHPPEVIRTRFLVGCDGAHSQVRAEIGHALQGKSARQLWGVMDILAVTDFPDVRLKSAIQSAQDGSILLIPREGGHMVRMYIELDQLLGDERAADRNVDAAMIIKKARAILSPFRLDVKEVVWWSAYEIGQRVCDRFDDADGDAGPRIFIAGDACHTHSPKAGQGMNVSMADSFNLGWKLAAVLRGQSEPALLCSYSQERQAKAQELIDFDKVMARLISTKPQTHEDALVFQQHFQRHGRYMAGVETRYGPSRLVGDGRHQDLATGFLVGQRFHSAPVVRVADGKRTELGHVLLADGRWRVMIFAPSGDAGQSGSVARLCAYLADDLIAGVTPKGQDIDSVIDCRAIFQRRHSDLNVLDMPPILRPQSGTLGLTDYEKIFAPDLKTGPDIFDLRGIDRAKGGVVIIRPDQFVADILPLEDQAGLSSFFAQVLRPQESV